MRIINEIIAYITNRQVLSFYGESLHRPISTGNPWLHTLNLINRQKIFSKRVRFIQYSWLPLSRTRLSRITAYLEVKIWSLPKHGHLTTGKKNIVEKGRNCSPLFHNIFNIYLTSRVQLHIYLINVVVRIIFSSILQILYVEVRISRSI